MRWNYKAHHIQIAKLQRLTPMGIPGVDLSLSENEQDYCL